MSLIENNISLSFESSVSMGMQPGYSSIDKFGENPDVSTGTSPEDIWEGGGTYNYDADDTAPIVSLASNDAADTQDIIIIGLDASGNEVEQTIKLNGTTRVALTTALGRVYRMQNDSSTDLAGTVFCYTGTGAVPTLGDANIRAIIDNGNNKTLMALYTIPSGKVGFLYRGEIGVSRAITSGEARVAYYSRRYQKSFLIKKRVNLSNAGSSLYQDPRSFPDVIPARTDIKLTCESVSANNMGLWGTFDVLLVDETLFSSSYLAAIGQPGY